MAEAVEGGRRRGRRLPGRPEKQRASQRYVGRRDRRRERCSKGGGKGGEEVFWSPSRSSSGDACVKEAQTSAKSRHSLVQQRKETPARTVSVASEYERREREENEEEGARG